MLYLDKSVLNKFSFVQIMNDFDLFLLYNKNYVIEDSTLKINLIENDQIGISISYIDQLSNKKFFKYLNYLNLNNNQKSKLIYRNIETILYLDDVDPSCITRPYNKSQHSIPAIEKEIKKFKKVRNFLIKNKKENILLKLDKIYKDNIFYILSKKNFSKSDKKILINHLLDFNSLVPKSFNQFLFSIIDKIDTSIIDALFENKKIYIFEYLTAKSFFTNNRIQLMIDGHEKQKYLYLIQDNNSSSDFKKFKTVYTIYNISDRQRYIIIYTNDDGIELKLKYPNLIEFKI